MLDLRVDRSECSGEDDILARIVACRLHSRFDRSACRLASGAVESRGARDSADYVTIGIIAHTIS